MYDRPSQPSEDRIDAVITHALQEELIEVTMADEEYVLDGVRAERGSCSFLPEVSTCLLLSLIQFFY